MTRQVVFDMSCFTLFYVSLRWVKLSCHNRSMHPMSRAHVLMWQLQAVSGYFSLSFVAICCHLLPVSSGWMPSVPLSVASKQCGVRISELYTEWCKQTTAVPRESSEVTKHGSLGNRSGAMLWKILKGASRDHRSTGVSHILVMWWFPLDLVLRSPILIWPQTIFIMFHHIQHSEHPQLNWNPIWSPHLRHMIHEIRMSNGVK